MEFLLSLAIMLIVARIFGELAVRIRLPALLGYIIAGLVMGPVLGLVSVAHIESFGMVGLTLLLFIAGFMEVETEQLLKEKLPVMLVGLIGALVSFGAGYLLAVLFGMPFISALFLGTILAATSISISVGVMIDAGKLASRVGRIILGAGVVDDIFGLLLLAVVSSIAVIGAMPSIFEFASIFGSIAAFFVIFFVAWFAVPKLLGRLKDFRTKEVRFSLVLFIVLLLAYLAEVLGLSSVLGAFIAGLVLSRVGSLETKSFYNDIEVVSYGIFIPLFFTLIGLKMVLTMDSLSFFTLALIIVAIASKIVGGGIAGLLGRLKKSEIIATSLAIVPRGEVAFIILLIGQNLGVIPPVMFSSVFLMVFVTIIFTPIALKFYLKDKKLPT